MAMNKDDSGEKSLLELLKSYFETLTQYLCSVWVHNNSNDDQYEANMVVTTLIRFFNDE